MYGKIFESMYEGTLYGHWQAIVTLQQLLVLCDSAGTIDMTPQAISARTSIPLDIIAKGLEVLSEPDQYTRTPGEEGRRIVLLDEHRPWGWRIVNHAKYQKMRSRADKLEADRLRVADKRKANKSNDVAGSRTTSHAVAEVAHADADVYASKPLAARATRGSRITKEWQLPKAWGLWAMQEQKTWTEDYTRKIGEMFRDHWSEVPGLRGLKLNWSGTWRNWVRKEGPMKGGSTAAPAASKPCCKCGGSLAGGHTSTQDGLMCNQCWSNR